MSMATMELCRWCGILSISSAGVGVVGVQQLLLLEELLKLRCSRHRAMVIDLRCRWRLSRIGIGMEVIAVIASTYEWYQYHVAVAENSLDGDRRNASSCMPGGCWKMLDFGFRISAAAARCMLLD